MAYRRLLRPAPRMRRTRQELPRKDPNELVWLFDLDNTLHDTSHKIFAQISVCMTRAVMQTLGVDEATAHELRQRYWARYGATMIGLAKHHGVNAQEFLDISHDFDIKPLLKAEKGIREFMRRFPGRKILVTNAPFRYARSVLKHLGILHLFDAIWSVEHMKILGQYRPKPSQALIRYILASEGIDPGRCVLVEDTLSNLKSVRSLGMRTVHIFHPGTPFAHTRKGRPQYVDLRTTRVSDLLLGRKSLRSR